MGIFSLYDSMLLLVFLVSIWLLWAVVGVLARIVTVCFWSKNSDHGYRVVKE